MPTVTSTKTVQLNLPDLVAALKTHFNMPPDSKVEFRLDDVSTSESRSPSYEVSGATITSSVQEHARTGQKA